MLGVDAGGMPERVTLTFEDGLFLACFTKDRRELDAAALCEIRRIRAAKFGKPPRLTSATYVRVDAPQAEHHVEEKVEAKVQEEDRGAFDTSD